MKTSLIILLSFMSSFFYPTSEHETASEYIQNFKEIAVSEMMRTGIPASIKLGQAMLESNMGRSELASYANNHFGIKCGGSWDGTSYYVEDDEYKKGKKIKSCFRKYDNVVESFLAHSEFLANSKRYADLFKYDRKDYKAWAHGLKKAGYATDPNYPTKLISVIEKFELYQYDNNETYFSSNSDSDKALEDIDAIESNTYAETTASTYAVQSVNRSKMIISTGNESLKQIAKDQNVSIDDLKKYNAHSNVSSSRKMKKGTVVYLEEKRYNYDGSEDYHLVRSGETMEDISNMYGVKLETLYLKNKMPRKAQPFPGEKVYLKGLIRLKNTPRYFKKGNRKASKTSRLF